MEGLMDEAQYWHGVSQLVELRATQVALSASLRKASCNFMPRNCTLPSMDSSNNRMHELLAGGPMTRAVCVPLGWPS